MNHPRHGRRRTAARSFKGAQGHSQFLEDDGGPSRDHLYAKPDSNIGISIFRVKR